MFKVVMIYPDGTTEEGDEVFETEDAAREYGQVQCSNFVAGGEVLHMSNPGDYPLSEGDHDVDFDVIEVDA
jgi:hypothetical protein